MLVSGVQSIFEYNLTTTWSHLSLPVHWAIGSMYKLTCLLKVRAPQLVLLFAVNSELSWHPAHHCQRPLHASCRLCFLWSFTLSSFLQDCLQSRSAGSSFYHFYLKVTLQWRMFSLVVEFWVHGFLSFPLKKFFHWHRASTVSDERLGTIGTTVSL